MSAPMSDEDLHSIPMLAGLLNILPQSRANPPPPISNTPSTLSTDEDKVYDRQIRTWGYEAQQRMKHANILIVGRFTGLAAEISKNLALAGIGHLTLCDNHLFTEETLNSNFLPNDHLQLVNTPQSAQALSANPRCTTAEGQGQQNNIQLPPPQHPSLSSNPYLTTPSGHLTEAQISICALQQLNPNVKISHITKPPLDISSLATSLNLSQFSTVIAVGINLLDASILNDMVRVASSDTHFFYTDLHNHLGIGFTDFNTNSIVSKTAVAATNRKERAKNAGSKEDKEKSYYKVLNISLHDSLRKTGLDIDSLLTAYKEYIKLITEHIEQSRQIEQPDLHTTITQLQSVLPSIPMPDFKFTNHLDLELVNRTKATVTEQTLQLLNTASTNPKDATNPPYHPVDISRNAVKQVPHQCQIILHFLSLFTSSLPTSSDFKSQASHSALNSSPAAPTLFDYVSRLGLTNGIAFAPFCSILGGIIGQGVLKTFACELQRNNLFNWLYLDLLDRSGECVASAIL